MKNVKGNSPVMIAVGVVVLFLVAGGAYFYLNQTSQTTQPTQDAMVEEESMEKMEDEEAMMEATDEAMMEDESMMMEEGAVVVEVEGGNYYFDPNEITVQEGETVKIVFTNAGGFHDFTIDEFDVATKQIDGGETIEVEFVADAAGEYEFYCSVGNHREQGMVGKLIVN